MSRVKRGVASHAKHKKVFKAAKGFYGRKKIPLELLNNQQKNLYNIPIEIEDKKKEILDHSGYKELILALENKV